MDEWLQPLLPVAFSAAVAGLVAVAGIFASTRRLRRDLASDIELRDAFPTRLRAEMDEEIRRRGFRLVALTRWPSVTKYEVLAIFGLVLTAPIAVYFMADVVRQIERDFVDLPSALMAGVGMFIVPLLLWRSFYTSWSDRSYDRYKFLEEHLRPEEVGEMFGLLGLANRFSVAAYLPVVGYPIGYLMWVSSAADWDLGIPVFGSTAIAMTGFLVLLAATNNNKLINFVLLYRWVPNEGVVELDPYFDKQLSDENARSEQASRDPSAVAPEAEASGLIARLRQIL